MNNLPKRFVPARIAGLPALNCMTARRSSQRCPAQASEHCRRRPDPLRRRLPPPTRQVIIADACVWEASPSWKVRDRYCSFIA